jgi:hypothetical protein
MSNRIISATIIANGKTTRYPTAGHLEHTKPVGAELLRKSGEIVIFEAGEPVDTFIPTSFFVPAPGKTGMWWKGTYKGTAAILCITSLTDGGEKVHGQTVSVLEPLKIKTVRR